MGFNNPGVPWREIERALSDRRRPRPGNPGLPEGANGGDSPAWSWHRPAYEPPERLVRRSNATPYAELHCHSCFSFLDGASPPEELVEQAARVGLEALAITDHDGFYGVVRFSEAAKAVGLPTIFGAELSLDLAKPQNGVADPEGSHLLVLARDPKGYGRLADTISTAQLDGREKGKPDYSGIDWSGVHGGHWLVLTGCRKGAVPQALLREGPAAATRELHRLVELFGRDNVAVELWDHSDPLDSARNDVLAQMATEAGVPFVATNNVHYAAPANRRLATALAAVRARRSLDDMAGWLPPASTAHLRSGDEQEWRFKRWPGAVERAAELGRACAFDLSLVAPKLPPFICPDDLDEMGYLRRLVEERAVRRYGTREAERVPGAWKQLDHELDVIERLGFPGYFLVVWDIVDFCEKKNIFCQGRGSAANSAVCFVLGITNADAVRLGLLFERFLSADRDGPPDIDIDIESGRREEVIQHVYDKHGRRHTAQVANVITYRTRSAVRDMAKALGFDPEQQDAWSKQIDPWSSTKRLVSRPDHDLPAAVVELAREVEHLPRHLGIHSGGMVICDRPIVTVCPVEWARMENRSVLQWDKDDCAVVGLVKFDLLGLGMLSALHGCVDFVREAHGIKVDLAEIPHDDPEVYDMLCRADSVGVFQVESRAQMATLPRLEPRTFYDLVVEVALIRPGPIQGGSVHPYIRRRKQLEEPTCLHPALEQALEKTLGVPLFQEQLMQIAIDVAGFTPAEADQLRQAMGSKRSVERMERLRGRLYQGMEARHGITGETADRIWDKLVAFASYGFPESHAVSFAYLVYASSWLKRYYPAAFCAALLNAQPMGFYSPHSLVQDARRHGVEVLTPDLNASAADALLVGGRPEPARQGAPPKTWGRGGPTVRLGLGSVREVSKEVAEAVVAERDQGGPYESLENLVRRVSLNQRQVEAFATAGAFGCFGTGGAPIGAPRARAAGRRRRQEREATTPVPRDGVTSPHRPMNRREALWVAGAVAGTSADRLEGVVLGVEAPTLPGMTPAQEARADLWATGVSPEGHPTRFVRDALDARGVVPAARLGEVDSRGRVTVAGVVTHRQRPATAGGTTFVNLEDETGLINVVVSKGCWAYHRRILLESPALLVRGRLERAEGVTNVIAQQVEPLPLDAPTRSRDFR